MIKKQLISLIICIGFIAVGLYNLGRNLSWELQILNLIGLLVFVYLAYVMVKRLMKAKK